MTRRHVNAAAAAIRSARETRQPCLPIREQFGIDSVDLAYAVQEVNTRTWVASGRVQSGCKIGLTSKSVQQQMGVGEPDFGTLFRDMERASGASIEVDSLIQPRVEAEIAFVLERDLSEGDLQLARLARSIAYAVPAIEIVDSAVKDWKISIMDTVADNASSGLYVLGGFPRRIADIDLELAGMVMERNDEQASVGVSAACLGNPLSSTLWLARKMNAVGMPMRAGDVILSGALGPMVDVKKGDRIAVRIGGMGEVRCRFA